MAPNPADRPEQKTEGSPNQSEQKLEGGPLKLQAMFDAMKSDYQTIRVVVLTTIACVVLLMVPVFWLARSFVSAKNIDDKLGLSAFLTPKIMETITKKVDSGYSKSFILRGNDPTADTNLLFYSEPGQVVKVVMRGSEYVPHQARVRVLIDNTVWKDDKELPLDIYLSNVPNELLSRSDTGDIHVMHIVPVGLARESTLVLQCLVLVSNR
jgi:hypothetical protein